MEVTRDAQAGTFTLRQKQYIERVFAKYLHGVERPRTSPFDTGADGAKRFMALKGASTDAEKLAMAGKDYLGLIGGRSCM
jgi:hypothetical protein